VSTFGDRVRSLRLAAHLRQTDFVVHGITQSQVSLIEHGDIVPAPVKIDILAKLLGISGVDLVAGTELQSRYDADRVPGVPDERALEAARLIRSQRIVAVQEAYRRVQRMCELLAARAGAVTIDDEAQYQFAVRICRRALLAVREYDLPIAERTFVVPSMIGDGTVDLTTVRATMQRSAGYLSSLILQFPEADTRVARQAIVMQIGLDRVDRFIDRESV
jgi:transcriptional regulator with XRE-family HTH domain